MTNLYLLDTLSILTHVRRELILDLCSGFALLPKGLQSHQAAWGARESFDTDYRRIPKRTGRQSSMLPKALACSDTRHARLVGIGDERHKLEAAIGPGRVLLVQGGVRCPACANGALGRRGAGRHVSEARGFQETLTKRRASHQRGDSTQHIRASLISSSIPSLMPTVWRRRDHKIAPLDARNLANRPSLQPKAW